ncbi:MAG: hypothetical protein M5U14_00690 [Acidimicrobiia bacterium]|nr:hypothetical protein [Acidimicrobiia bacterium]
MTLDDLELELRKLPGVRAAGFTERDDVLLVQLHVAAAPAEPGLAVQATRIACRHSERPVAVELVRWRTVGAPAPVNGGERAEAEGVVALAEEEAREAAAPVRAERRVRLLAVLTFPDTDELEVHLTLDGRRTIGRAAASEGLLGAVEATIDALQAFTGELAFAPGWARVLETAVGEPFLVAVGLAGAGEAAPRHGLATGSSPIEAASRATLHALNRTVALDLEQALG